MSRVKILVCGVSGFIGRNVAVRLAQREDLQVYGTYWKSAPPPELTQAKVSLVKADLTRREDVDRVIGGKQVIIQAAAVTSGAKDITARPHIHVTDNAIMNSLIFRAAFEHKVQHVVFFSCAVMYPSQESPVREDDFNYQIGRRYFGAGWTKVYLEKMCEFYAQIGAAKYTAIRHSNIFGPYDKFDLDRSHVFGATVAKVMSGVDDTVDVWGDGSEKRDLLYVSDLVDFVELVIARQKVPFELINVGSGTSVTVRELVEKIVAGSGQKRSLRFDASKPTIKFDLTLDIQRAREAYGWQPKVTLDEGIKKTVAWYTSHYLPVV
jgi:nucleoside-diphosphate-sugar epimerase